MIRLLLSLLALITGAAVPGMAQACEFSAPGTEIGARADTGAQVSAEAARPSVRTVFAAMPVPGYATSALRVFTAPRAPAVLIGIDRARQ